MTVDTPNGPATLESATEAKDGGVLFLARHRNGSTWLYAPVDLEPRTADDAAALDVFIETCLLAARTGRRLPALV